LHVNGSWQSLSVAQVRWQVPGNEVVVTQVLVAPASTATGGGAVPLPPPAPDGLDVSPPDETVPPPALPDEAEQVPRVTGWQKKPSPQSELALHVLKAQDQIVVSVHTGGVMIGAPASGQSMLAGQAGAVPPLPLQVVLGWPWQTIPDPQSLSVTQVWARAAPAKHRAAVATTVETNESEVMGFPLDGILLSRTSMAHASSSSKPRTPIHAVFRPPTYGPGERRFRILTSDSHPTGKIHGRTRWLAVKCQRRGSSCMRSP
jgi:hypothetical protein